MFGLRVAAMRRSIYLICALMLCAGCAIAPRAAIPAPPVAFAPRHSLADAGKLPTLVAIGASDAFGIGTDDPKTQSWPVALAGELGGPVHLVNLGIPSATAEIAQRDEAPIAEAVNPTIITVWLGVNDYDTGVTLADFTQHLQALLSDLRLTTAARIYVANLPDLTQEPRYSLHDRATLAQDIANWNSVIFAACSTNDATVVDLYAASDIAGHPEYIAADGFHPSTKGAQRIAAVFAAAITGHSLAQGATS
jgi:lysophospholipase L1-like esterase